MEVKIPSGVDILVNFLCLVSAIMNKGRGLFNCQWNIASHISTPERKDAAMTGSRRLSLIAAVVAILAAITTMTALADAGDELSESTSTTSVPAVQIAAGGAHMCAVTEDGDVLCWGANYDGQLGDTTALDRNAPVYVGIWTRKAPCGRRRLA